MTLNPSLPHLQIAWEGSHVGWIALEGCWGAWPPLGITGLLVLRGCSGAWPWPGFSQAPAIKAAGAVSNLWGAAFFRGAVRPGRTGTNGLLNKAASWLQEGLALAQEGGILHEGASFGKADKLLLKGINSRDSCELLLGVGAVP